MTRTGKWSTVWLRPQGAAAMAALKAKTGLSGNDLYNLALIALANQWTAMPDYQLRPVTHPATPGQPRKHVEWSF